MKKIIVLVSLVMAIWQCEGQRPADNPLITNMDSLADRAAGEFFHSPGHVGLSLAVYKDGRIGFYDYGTSKKNSGAPVNKRTLYEIGSITKTFTGILLAKAVLEGRIKLDEDVRKYLGQPYPNLEYKGHPITARQLVTHRSGLPDNIPDNSALFKNANFDSLPFQLVSLEKDYDRERYLSELHELRLDTIPGSVYFRYSNIGVKLLSFMLENIYGISYEDMVRNYITNRLGMKNTSIRLSTKDSSRLATGYSPGGVPMPYSPPNAGASGGLKSTTEDMIKYVSWNLNEGDSLIKQAHSLIDGDLASYARGMGWNMAYTKEGDRKVWQSGGTYGMSSQMVLFPDLHIGFILLANDGGFNTQGELEKIALSILAGIKLQHRP